MSGILTEAIYGYFIINVGISEYGNNDYYGSYEKC